MGANYILDFDNIFKTYPGVIALNEVDFKVKEGEIHGLVGKNGAGKTTLVSVLYGRISHDAGKIFIKGEKINKLTPPIAQKVGIALVPQEPQVVSELSIAENLFLKDLKIQVDKKGVINWNKIKEKAEEILKKLKINIDVDVPIGELTVGQQQLISIGRAFYVNKADIILLDEVTASLSFEEKEVFFDLVKKRNNEKTIVFISHMIPEIFELCDRVSVLRDGRKIACKNISEISEEELVSLIVGDVVKKVSKSNIIKEKKYKDCLLNINNLTRINEFEDVNFKVKRSEVVGIAGLRGAGRTELLNTIVGMTSPDKGDIYIKGDKTIIKNPSDALQKGIAYLSENREDGVISCLSVKNNITISNLDKFLSKLGLINIDKEISETNKMKNKLQIKSSSIHQEIQFLSGGNKQKAIISRLLCADPDLYILDEPTKGIDVGAKNEILNIIDKELSKNAGIIITSPSVQELMNICDKILVMYQGIIIDKFKRSEYDEELIYKVMQGIGREKYEKKN